MISHPKFILPNFDFDVQCDQAKQGIVNNPSKMDDYVKEHGFAGWFEISAKENINIEQAAKALVSKVSKHFNRNRREKSINRIEFQILLNDKIINSGDIIDAEKFNLDGRAGEQKKNCSC